jgi:tetratricopeptide (TPR) repeat protein
MKNNTAFFFLCAAIVVTAAAFIPALSNGFTFWDDDLYVTRNPKIMDLSRQNIKEAFTTFQLGFYHPLTILSFMCEFYFFRLNPAPYHATNLILHLGNTALVFWLIHLLSGKDIAALVTAILFGIHPLHVESVAWIAQRKDVLSAFFFLGTLILYLWYRKTARARYYVLSLIVFILSFLAKPMGIMLPFVLFLFDYLEKRVFDKKTLCDKIPFFAVAAGFAVVTFFAEKHIGAINREGPVASLDNLFIGCHALIFYLKQTVYPLQLSSVYPPPAKTNGQFPLFFLLSPIVVLGLIAVMLFLRKRSRIITFGLLFYIIMLLPVLQFIPVTWTVAADRYTYLPLIGLFYIAGEFLQILYGQLTRPTRVAFLLILSFFIIGLATLTWQRCNVWKDSVSLWADVIRKYPGFMLGHMNRGYAHAIKGELDSAIADYNEALRIDPGHAETYNNRGSARAAQGNHKEAIADYTLSLALSADNPKALNNRGNAYLAVKDFDRAIADFSRALEIKTWHIKDYKNRALIHNNRGYAYTLKGDFDKALTDYDDALKYNPKIAELYNNRGNLFYMKKDYPRAIAEYSQAVAIEPGMAQSYNNRGYMYFLSGEFEKARADVRSALALGFPVDQTFIKELEKAPAR